jgi:hypothetical protein
MAARASPVMTKPAGLRAALHLQAGGHLTGAVMLRQLKYETIGVNAIDDSTTAVAVRSGRYNSIRTTTCASRPTPAAVSAVTSAGISSDSVLTATVTGCHRRRCRLWASSMPSVQVRGNQYYAASSTTTTALTGLAVTESVNSISANLIYSPLPKLDVGFELRLRIANWKVGQMAR